MTSPVRNQPPLLAARQAILMTDLKKNATRSSALESGRVMRVRGAIRSRLRRRRGVEREGAERGDCLKGRQIVAREH